MKTTESKMIWSSISVKNLDFDNFLPTHAPYFEEHTGKKSSDWSVHRYITDIHSPGGLWSRAESKLSTLPKGKIVYLMDHRSGAPTRARRAGFAKDTFPYIAPDFDAPLEDFSSQKKDSTGTRQPRLTGPIMFVRILLRTWRLNQTDAIPLLGLEKSDISYANDLLSGSVTLRGRDIKDRIAYLFRIRKTLSALFRDEEVENDWLREPHDALDGQNPIALLREGSMENLLLVKEYVEAAAGR